MLSISNIQVEIVRKNIKNVYIYVKPPDGRVIISAPKRMSIKKIEEIIKSKETWIKKKIAHFESRRPLPERQFVSGETLMLWGRRLALRVEYGQKYSLVVNENNALFVARKESTVERRAKFVREWYREQLKEQVALLLPKWEKITGLKAASWQSKSMKTRWGTCNPKTKKIWLALQLAKYPVEYLEYIMLHELLHLKERHHNKLFYSLMDQYMPHWREIKAKLDASTPDYLE